MKAGLKYDCDSCPLSTKRIKSGGEGRYPGSRHRVRGRWPVTVAGPRRSHTGFPAAPILRGVLRIPGRVLSIVTCCVTCGPWCRYCMPDWMDGQPAGSGPVGKFLRGSQSPDLEITKDQKSRSGTVANTSRSANDAANARPTVSIPAAPLSAIMTWERTCYTNP